MKTKRRSNMMLVVAGLGIMLMSVCVLSFIGITAAWGVSEESNAVFCYDDEISFGVSAEPSITIEPLKVVSTVSMEKGEVLEKQTILETRKEIIRIVPDPIKAAAG